MNANQKKKCRKKLLTPSLFFAIFILCVIAPLTVKYHPNNNNTQPTSRTEGYAGSQSCQPCHQQFHKLWQSSNHELTTQPMTKQFASTKITPLEEEFSIGRYQYAIEQTENKTFAVQENTKQLKILPIAYTIEGKNAYYFLTPMQRGQLQVLPISYDFKNKQWFDTTASLVRHCRHHLDQQIDWSEPELTFSTSCNSCHVSQLSLNYDIETDTYTTACKGPGLNCEKCHGPSAEHILVCSKAEPGKIPEDLKIISTANFTPQQINSFCAPCHAKARTITTQFNPADRYFDNYDLVAFESPDYYPDGRDLGENFTFTSWRMSPCVKSGKLDCLYCHSSSGKYKFSSDQANKACMPCHHEKVDDPTAHTHHQIAKDTPNCVSCHMPKTEFERMTRSDHSMRPPTPAVTAKFRSPNACNSCHTDKNPSWTNEYVRKWYKSDYQAKSLHMASLVQDARNRDWTNLDEMLEYINSPDRDEVFAVSIIRLLQSCERKTKWPAIQKTLNDSSPWIRSAAAAALAANLNPQTKDMLVAAMADDFRLVRIQAARALSAYPDDLLGAEEKELFEKASAEYLTSIQSRPDNWVSHYNLGNYYLNRDQLNKALESFKLATRMQPKSIPALVKTSIVHSRMGNNIEAESSLRDALKIDPNNPEVNLNLALLLAETGDPAQAESLLRTILQTDPNSAQAAYNLAIMVGSDDLGQAIGLCQKALTSRPNDSKYAYTLAYYLRQAGQLQMAANTLTPMIEDQTAHADIYMLLAQIYADQGKDKNTTDIYQQATQNNNLPITQREHFQRILETIPRN